MNACITLSGFVMLLCNLMVGIMATELHSVHIIQCAMETTGFSINFGRDIINLNIFLPAEKKSWVICIPIWVGSRPLTLRGINAHYGLFMIIVWAHRTAALTHIRIHYSVTESHIPMSWPDRSLTRTIEKKSFQLYERNTHTHWRKNRN